MIGVEVKDINNIYVLDVLTLKGLYRDSFDGNMYSVSNNCVSYIGISADFKLLQLEDDEIKKTGTISEEFALKMLAVSNGKVKDLEL